MDVQLPTLYNMIWFLMKNSGGGLNWDNILNLHPFEFELFYFMAINDAKELHQQ